MAEALLLFGLHDARGTVHSAAFLALDHGLRGALLAELRLRGRVQTRRGSIRRHPANWSRTDSPSLDAAMEVLERLPSPSPVMDWLVALETGLELRRDLVAGLTARGILTEAERERALLPSTLTHPMTDADPESQMLQRIWTAVQSPEPPSARLGTLIALIDATNLVDVLFDKGRREGAREKATWVRERDAIVEAVHTVVSRTEGTWLDSYDTSNPAMRVD